MSVTAAPGSRFELTYDLEPFRAGLIEACGYGDLTYGGLEVGLMTDALLAFTIPGVVLAVFQLDRPVLTCIALAGENPDDWLADLDALGLWLAADQGCTKLRCHGRPGWARALRKMGYRAQSLQVGKEI